MQDVDLYRSILEIEVPWRVAEVRLDTETSEVHVESSRAVRIARPTGISTPLSPRRLRHPLIRGRLYATNPLISRQKNGASRKLS